MRTVIYARVSSGAQERDGTSLDTQVQAAENHVDSLAEVVEVVRESGSGYSLERPGLERVRALIRSGKCDQVVAYAIDRLSRNQNHIGVLLDEAERFGVTLEFVTERFEDTAIGRFILAARAFVAEVEREKISERTQRGKLERARRGLLPHGTGAGQFGYRYVIGTGRRVVDEEQAAIVRTMFEGFMECGSYSGVAARLNDAGIKAFKGGTWHPLTVRRMLSSRSYLGETVFRSTRRVRVQSGGRAVTRVVQRPEDEWVRIDGATPAIVDDALWHDVQALRSQVKPRTKRASYLLGGRVDCLVCGAPMVGHLLSSEAGVYRYYRCRHLYDRNSGGSCLAKYVPADALETAVLTALAKHTPADMDEAACLLIQHEVHVLADQNTALVEGRSQTPPLPFGRSPHRTPSSYWREEVTLAGSHTNRP